MEQNKVSVKFTDKAVPFVVRVKDGKMNVWLNDKHLVKDQPLKDWEQADSHYLSIGGRYWWSGSTLSYPSLRIRKLSPKQDDPKP